MEFEPVIGLEVHLQLNTASKAFSGASPDFGAAPNSHVDCLTLGLPGTLPVLNKRVVEFAIMMGIATNCEIRRLNRFARKHYFYPDLPKGYQISQYDEPICERGKLEISLKDATRTIGIKRIHMEEDAGKNIHDGKSGASLVDLNRAGVALLEIVSEPDIRTPAEAAAYLKTIRQIARYLGISDGNMEEGSLRCDANISLRPVGQMKFGTRTEIKNINSFKFVERALEYEITRQLSLLKNGKPVLQETMTYDSAAGVTRSLRSKEESADYRYFPDPDLPPLIVEESWVREISGKMPLLPAQVVAELTSEFGLSVYDATVISLDRANVDYFKAAAKVGGDGKLVSNWLTSELYGFLNKNNLTIEKSPVTAQNLGELVKLIKEEVISSKMAKSVFEEMCSSSKPPKEIVANSGAKQITDEGVIKKFVEEAFDKNPSQAAGFIGGEEKLQAYFVGQVMKLSKGSAHPRLVNELIQRVKLERTK